MKILKADNRFMQTNSYGLDFDKLVNPTKLYSDYIRGGMSDFYRYSFIDNDSLPAVADSIDKKHYDRQNIFSTLHEANKNLGASEYTLSNIELLQRPETLTVFSGQQTSFCANPMYIIYKALTTVKLAQKYSEKLNRPVVPCFWMATDDHDFEEVRSANFLLRSGETETVVYNPAKDPSGYPVAQIVLDDGVSEFCGSVNEALLETEFKNPLLESFREYYKNGNKLSHAFARVFNLFLGEYGIVLVDPNFPGVKSLYQNIFLTEINEHEATYGFYKKRFDELEEQGYHNQVHKSPENLNIFHHTPLRTNITIDNGGYRVESLEGLLSKDDLLDKVKGNPENFSTNVLLRPIAQCNAFPTLAHVVGPSELAYFAQIEPLFKFFEVPFPVAFPRAGMTIVEPHIGKIIKKYDLDLPSLKNELEPTIGKVVERLFPSEAANNIMSMNDCTKRDLDELIKQLNGADPEGARHIKNFKKHIDFELKQLRKKLKASNKKRHEELTSQIRRARAFLFPNNGLQERVISPLYYANKYGPEIFEVIYEALIVDKPTHTILEL